MAKKKKAAAPAPAKDVERVGMTPQRKAELDAETEAALASSRKSEADRIARVGAAGVKGTQRKAVEVDANPGVKFKKKITRDKKTGRAKVAEVEARPTVGQEDQGPSAAPKIQLPGPVISTGKKLARTGVRAPKDKELKRGVTSVSTAPRKKRQKKVKVVPVPKPGQAGKLDGELVRVTPENATQIYEQRRRTTLPDAKEAEMTPAGRPAVEPVILPSRLRGSQSGKNLGGFARPHKEVASVAHEALDHLQAMAKNEPGTPLHHAAHEAFNVAHAQLGQISNNNFHRFMGMGRTIVTNHRDKDMDTALKVHRQGVLGKLEEGRIAEGSRGDRSGKGGNNGS